MVSKFPVEKGACTHQDGVVESEDYLFSEGCQSGFGTYGAQPDWKGRWPSWAPEPGEVLGGVKQEKTCIEGGSRG